MILDFNARVLMQIDLRHGPVKDGRNSHKASELRGQIRKPSKCI